MQSQHITAIVDGQAARFAITGTATTPADLVRLLVAARARDRRVFRFVRLPLLRSTRYRLTDAGRQIIGIRPRGRIRAFLAPSWPRKPLSA